MCDTIKKKDLPDNKKPQYVYKRVQKVGEGKYISPVMGELMLLNTWKKAPKRPELKGYHYDLVNLIKRPYKKATWTCSSSYAVHHDGMWGCFKNRIDAIDSELVSNFTLPKKKGSIKFPSLVVKCEVKGTVHQAQFMLYDSFLVEYIKIIEELDLVRFP